MGGGNNRKVELQRGGRKGRGKRKSPGWVKKKVGSTNKKEEMKKEKSKRILLIERSDWKTGGRHRLGRSVHLTNTRES